ncbi:MAG: hypothetical protein AUJ50_03505 [Candidatus Aenigmarchaeota archaeon CG1_02_38_14]|nr:MAG: hypothetical protein AUJ50_03505 [Candidatus Aenigmarchaeota archaeon CG1_02_38_14]
MRFIGYLRLFDLFQNMSPLKRFLRIREFNPETDETYGNPPVDVIYDSQGKIAGVVVNGQRRPIKKVEAYHIELEDGRYLAVGKYDIHSE